MGFNVKRKNALIFSKQKGKIYLDLFDYSDIINKKGVIFLKSLEKLTITDIPEVMTITFPRGKSVNIFSRDSFGLSLCIEGQLTYSHKGKTYVSDPNHIVFLPKGESYTIRGDKTGVFPVINFLCDEDFCDTVVSIPIKSVEPYLADFKKIKTLFLFEKKRLKIMSIFYNMIQGISSETANSYGVLLPALRFLEENCFRADLSITELANRCNMSEVYFRKLFLKQIGTSPKQYILDVRIEKAKQLLSDGVLKVGAISEKCGFTNQYHFSRIFRQKTGLTPTEYMKQNRIYEI